MKNAVVVLMLISLIFSCSNSKKHQGNLVVEGKVKGLRLGTLLIKKLENDSIKSLDSIKVDGNENFEFQTNIKEPQILVLSLPEIKDGDILFFAAPKDTIKIYTFLETFALNPVVIGGVNQERLQTYKDILHKFSNKELDLFKAKYEASKKQQNKLADSLTNAYDNLLRKRELYKLNFIFTNADKPVGAYVGYTSFYKNKQALDTIYKMLKPDIKQSKYGKEIKKILDKK